MDFIRNILYIGAKDDFQEIFFSSIEGMSKKLKIHFTAGRSQVSEYLGKTKMNAVFMNVSEKSTTQYVLRLLEMYQNKTNTDLKIFCTSDNFEVLKEVVKDNSLKNLELLPGPLDAREVAERVSDSVFDKKLSKKIVTKSSGTLTVDLEFIHVFVNATKKVLEEMGKVKDLTHKKPTFMDQNDTKLEAGIASRIMISSDFFKGNFYVIFPEQTFLTLYAKAVFEEHQSINEENSDFAGELANIIYGQSKKVFAASGLNLDMAIPSVHRSSHVESEIVILIPFESSIGKFYIAVAPGAL